MRGWREAPDHIVRSNLSWGRQNPAGYCNVGVARDGNNLCDFRQSCANLVDGVVKAAVSGNRSVTTRDSTLAKAYVPGDDCDCV